VMFFTGVHAAHVPVERFDVSIGPDLRGLATMAKRIFGGALLLVVVIGLVLLALLRALNREAMRPLKETTAALRRLAARDFTPYAVEGPQRGEMGELARAYTGAAATVASALEERRLAETEMQRFIADAGHELKTPLTVIMGFVDVLERGGLSAETSARLYASMRAETTRMRGMIESLIVLARLGAPDARRLDLVDAGRIADAVADTLGEIATPRVLSVEHHGPPAVVVAAEDDLYDAVFNCVENALKYGDGSDVNLAVSNAGGRVTIAVRDRGPGMPDEDRRRAFERFYRGDGTRGVPGSGLGLSIVKRVVDRCHGSVAITSDGAGTTVRIELPAMPSTVANDRKLA
jgi:two-component system OmpR family sensor kinase